MSFTLIILQTSNAFLYMRVNDTFLIVHGCKVVLLNTHFYKVVNDVFIMYSGYFDVFNTTQSK